MPRTPRIYLENALYYITGKGDDSQRIFKDSEDYKAFLDLLKKYKAQYGFKLFAFCLLPDHYHLLMELPVQKEQIYKMGALSSIMHDLNSSYTKYFNGKYSRKGHLFRERYKSSLVEKKHYLLKLAAYVHLNPKRLNLVPCPEQYPYSSYILYLNKELSLDALIGEEKEEMYNLLNGKSYAECAELVFKEIDIQALADALQKGILGTDVFVQRVKQALASYRRESPPGGLRFGKKLMLGSLIVIVSALGITYALRLTMAERKEGQGRQLSASSYKLPVQIKELLRDLEGAEWQIRIIPLSKGAVQNDIVSFREGKFVSHNLSARNYLSSEYFLVIEDDRKITWESQAEGRDATALWRGEIRKGEIEGGLRLRYADGRTQDFSFVSVGYVRKK